MSSSSAEPVPAQNEAMRRASRRLVLIVCVMSVVPIISLSTFLVLLVGLLPTVVAMIVDRTPQHYATACVGGLNIAGVAPFLAAMWFNPAVSDAPAVLTNPFALAVMYLSAAAGWALFAGVPALFTTLDGLSTQRRVQRLEERRAALAEEWGEDHADFEDVEAGENE